MSDLLGDKEFQRLEKDYKFLSRARESELEKLAYVIVDIETTGLNPVEHEIIEIGALKVEGKEIKGVYNTLISPTQAIPPQVEEITGISPEIVEGQPKISEVLPSFHAFISNSILIAHNADFDIGFLKHHSAKCLGKELNNFSICTVKLSRSLLPNLENHKLHTVANYFKIQTPNRHRALGDAEITYGIWCKLIELLKSRRIRTREDLERYMGN